MMDSPHDRSGDLLSGILLGDSLAMRRVRARVARLAPASIPVLIEGPTGSGKELVAGGLHSLSGRAGRFVAVNVCAIGESMFEDALFGHARGAFTGAIDESIGLVGEADAGTLFLDEIGSLSVALQSKLLRVLDTREFRPVGAKRDRRSDFRLVAATNEDLSAAAAAGHFREDLLFRLRAGLVRLPTLRERREDIRVLALHFARDVMSSPTSSSAQPHENLSDAALDLLAQHAWRGNVRELKHVIELAALLAGDAHIDLAAVSQAIDDVCGPQESAARRDTRSDLERQRVKDALEAVEWDTTLAAERLGVNRSHVYRLMQRLGIIRPSQAGMLRRGCPSVNEVGPSVTAR
jgi:DNA-binding NtrC family response regulator